LKSDAEILRELKKASESLLVMSESDYPLEVIRWDGQVVVTPEYLCHIIGKPPASPIQEIDLDTFFQMSGIFQNVMELLKKNLAEVKVYKVGEISIPVYILGRSPEGNWLGFSTRLIQT